MWKQGKIGLMLRKSLEKSETKFVLFLAWIVVPSVLTLLGFYFGTIFGSREHKIDLQVAQIHVGFMYARIFFAISILAAIIVTKIIPPVIMKDYADREAKWDNRVNEHSAHH